MLILPPSDAQSHGPGPWQLNWILLLAGVDTVTFWSVALTWTITRPCNFTKARKRPKPAASLQGFINLGRLVYFRGLGDIREARDLAVASGPYRGPQGVTFDRENKCGEIQGPGHGQQHYRACLSQIPQHPFLHFAPVLAILTAVRRQSLR
jgi:hypothetical protein